jgi:hypothetical protein
MAPAQACHSCESKHFSEVFSMESITTNISKERLNFEKNPEEI